MEKSFLIAFLLAFSVLPLSADVLYNVTVNTSAYQGRTGYLDFQLGAGPDSQQALVAVQNFSADGLLIAANNQISGNVTGTLPGTVTLTNTQQFNDYFAGFTYGRTVAFNLNFSGPAITAPTGNTQYGSPFFFGLYDNNQAPLGVTDGLGNAFLIQVNTNGTTTPQVYNSVVSVNSAVTAVPEPEACFQVGLGLCLVTIIHAAVKAAKEHGQVRHHCLLP